MIDWTKPIRVRETGARAGVMCTDLKSPDFPIGIRYFDRDKEYITNLRMDGRANICHEFPFVENIPEMIEGYLNVCNYPSRGTYIGYLYTSLKESKQGELGTDMIARIKICHEVGQFDE